MLILDTNVVSELMRPVPDPEIASWVAERATSSLFLTAVTEAELRYGLAVMPPGKRREGLATGLERMLKAGFANRVLPFDSDAARAYAQDRRRTAPRGPADRASRLPDRSDCPSARHGGCDAQRSALRGHGHRNIKPMGRCMSETIEAFSRVKIEARLRDAGGVSRTGWVSYSCTGFWTAHSLKTCFATRSGRPMAAPEAVRTDATTPSDSMFRSSFYQTV